MSEPYQVFSDDDRRQLAEVLDALREAVDAVDGFNRAAADNIKFEAVAALPVVLAKTGATLAKVVTRLADAKQARLAELKTRDTVKAHAPMPEDIGGHGSLDASRPGE